jgi:hypothetical protein
VRRYLAHAIRPGAPLTDRVRLAMTGRIKAGPWLPFSAEQTLSARSFVWRASVGRVTPLRVVDRYAGGAGRTEGRLLGHVRLFGASDANTTRSAAGCAARRWGNAGQKAWGYIPCGCEVHAERTFADLTLPSEFSVGWWFGTPRYAPFFRAALTAAETG